MIDNTLKELTKDKIAIWIIRLFLLVILLFFIIFSIRTCQKDKKGEPVNYLWGLYKTNKVDTIVVIKHDTIFRILKQAVNPITKSETKYYNETNISAHDQKGGQTAREIINNN